MSSQVSGAMRLHDKGGSTVPAVKDTPVASSSLANHPRLCTVKTSMLLSDAAARLKNGSFKMTTLPMSRNADVLVGMDGNIHR